MSTLNYAEKLVKGQDFENLYLIMVNREQYAFLCVLCTSKHVRGKNWLLAIFRTELEQY